MRLDRQEQWATVRHFRLAIALVEYGSVLHASRALNISQPTASKLLHELEDAVGVHLFDRNRRGVTPTEVGRAFVERGKMVLAQIDHVSETIEALGKGHVGRVAVGVMLTGSSYLVPAAIEKLWALKPTIRVKVVEGISDELIPRLITGELDFLMGRLSDARANAILHQEALFSEDAVIVARRSHPLAIECEAKIEDLVQESWILPPSETALRKQFDNIFYAKEISPPHPAVETASLFNTLWLLQRTNLLGLLPRSVISNAAHNAELICLPSFEPLILEKIGILRLKGASLSPASAALMGSLREVMQSVSMEGIERGINSASGTSI